MKKILLIVSTALILTTLSVSAHPGRTDSFGGHYNHSTGTYHFHDGSSAGRNNNSSSNFYNKEYDDYVFDDDSTDTSSSTQANANPSDHSTDAPKKFSDYFLLIFSTIFESIFFIFGSALLLFMLVCFVCVAFRFIAENFFPAFKSLLHFKQHRIAKLIDECFDIVHREELYNSKINNSTHFIENPPQKPKPPFFAEIKDNKLVAKKGITYVISQLYNKEHFTPFTFYVSEKGHCYHTKNGCSYAKTPIDIFENTSYIKKFRPCRICTSLNDGFILDIISTYNDTLYNYINYEAIKQRLRDEIKEEQKKIEYLTSRKTKIMKKLKKKERYILKQPDLSIQYNKLLKELSQM